jgi:hypothetical protein
MNSIAHRQVRISVWRVVLVSLAAVFVPSITLLTLRAWITGAEFAHEVRQLAAIWLVLILPVSLMVERLSWVRLRASVTIWLSVGLFVGVGYRVAIVLWAAWHGGTPSPGLELFAATRPYYLGDSVSDALLLTSVGLIIWAFVFWQPEASRYSLVRRAWISGSGARRGAIRFSVALLSSVITAIIANSVSALLSGPEWMPQ